MSLKTLLKIGTILTIGLSASAFSANNVELAKQAHQLSINIQKTADLEQNRFCYDRLMSATYFADESGKQFMNNESYIAKETMKQVSMNLAYTAVENCSQAASIAIYKQEADSIISNN